MGFQTRRGSSTVRRSDSRRRRKSRTPPTVSESGVPEFTSSTPVRGGPACHAGDGSYLGLAPVVQRLLVVQRLGQVAGEEGQRALARQPRRFRMPGGALVAVETVVRGIDVELAFRVRGAALLDVLRRDGLV